MSLAYKLLGSALCLSLFSGTTAQAASSSEETSKTASKNIIKEIAEMGLNTLRVYGGNHLIYRDKAGLLVVECHPDGGYVFETFNFNSKGVSILEPLYQSPVQPKGVPSFYYVDLNMGGRIIEAYERDTADHILAQFITQPKQPLEPPSRGKVYPSLSYDLDPDQRSFWAAKIKFVAFLCESLDSKNRPNTKWVDFAVATLTGPQPKIGEEIAPDIFLKKVSLQPDGSGSCQLQQSDCSLKFSWSTNELTMTWHANVDDANASCTGEPDVHEVSATIDHEGRIVIANQEETKIFDPENGYQDLSPSFRERLLEVPFLLNSLRKAVPGFREDIPGLEPMKAGLAMPYYSPGPSQVTLFPFFPYLPYSGIAYKYE